MDLFWKWLMRTDARGIVFLTSGLFLLVLGWWTWREFDPPRTVQPALLAEAPLALPAPATLGVLALVSNQFAPDALVVPVNPFRPTFEALVRDQASTAIQERHDGEDRVRNRKTRPRPPGESHAPASDAPNVPLPPMLTYRGLLQRPDGKLAAYLHDSGTNIGSFLVAGERLRGLELLAADKAQVRLRLPDGMEIALPLNTPLQLPGATP